MRHLYLRWLQTKLGDAVPGQDCSGKVGEENGGPPPKDAANSNATGHGQVDRDDPEAPVKPPFEVNNNKAQSRDVGLRPGTRTVLVTDTAFQT